MLERTHKQAFCCKIICIDENRGRSLENADHPPHEPRGKACGKRARTSTQHERLVISIYVDHRVLHAPQFGST
jgi:hypothetical protein